jgi:YidC/Oxa1 family membrane protein insertase
VETRRLLLAVTLSFAVLMIWTYFFPPKPSKPPAAPAAESIATDLGTDLGTEAAPDQAAGTAPGASGTVAARPTPALPAAPEVFAAAEEQVVLDGGRLKATFTNRGAQLLSMTDRPDRQKNADPIELVRPRAGGLYPYSLVDRGLRPLPVNDALFSVTRGADGRSAIFRYRGPQGSVEKRFTFDPKGLLQVQVRADGPDSWGVVLGPGVRNPTSEQLHSQFERRAAVLKIGDEVRVEEAKKAENTKSISAGTVRWVGLEDTYFLSASIPQEGVERVLIQPLLMETPADEKAPARYVPMPPVDDLTGEQKDLVREYRVVLQAAGNAMSLESFWGAKEYDRLAALPYGLQETVAFGSLRFLALPLLAGLHWIHDHVVANYGWAIVLMTVVIKILLLPLTHSSTVSMRKMQKLNPKIQAIRDRYRTKMRDKSGRPNLESQRKMNDEVMALYKTEGVNPAGGCLPLVLQMPILFAFYRLLTTAAELRGAPWILWIADLSVKDPYYMLPIVMGLTQFLQVLWSPQVGDPMQRRLFLFMPLMMTVFFLSFPSGLVLYWLTNSILTIAQQGVYNRFMPMTNTTT